MAIGYHASTFYKRTWMWAKRSAPPNINKLKKQRGSIMTFILLRFSHTHDSCLLTVQPLNLGDHGSLLHWAVFGAVVLALALGLCKSELIKSNDIVLWTSKAATIPYKGLCEQRLYFLFTFFFSCAAERTHSTTEPSTHSEPAVPIWISNKVTCWGGRCPLVVAHAY